MQYKVIESETDQAPFHIPGLTVYFDEFNRRLVIKDMGLTTSGQIIEYIAKLAAEINWLSKIIVFCREYRWKDFAASGYRLEGYMNHYFKGNPAVLVSKFLGIERFLSKDFLQEDGVLEKIFAKPGSSFVQGLPPEFQIRLASSADIPQLVELFKKVFKLYPTPVKEPKYLQSCMNRNYHFQAVFHKGKIISAASAEIDMQNQAAEVTDCATLAEYRGQGLMYQLVQALEQEMAKRQVITLFSLARAKSAGINKVLCGSGYEYRGRLVNNCRICTGYEDMNIWEKYLKA